MNTARALPTRSAELNSTCRPVSGLVSGPAVAGPTDRLPTLYAVAD